MATIINNPGERVDSGNGVGVILGIIAAVVIALALLLYGIPGLRGGPAPANNAGTPDASLDVNIGTGGAENGAGSANAQ